jgi:hypothetical protein
MRAISPAAFCNACANGSYLRPISIVTLLHYCTAGRLNATHALLATSAPWTKTRPISGPEAEVGGGRRMWEDEMQEGRRKRRRAMRERGSI